MSSKVSYKVLNTVRFGGFEAERIEDQDLIFVRAIHWKGAQQPRIVCAPGSKEHKEWSELLDKSSGNSYTTEFTPTQNAASDLADQWLMHTSEPRG